MFRKQNSKSTRGQSLVEFAISLTLVLLLLAGAVDFGMAFFSFIAIRDAAQEGALYGSMAPTDIAGIESRVRHASTTPIDMTDPDANINITVRTIGRACEGGGIEVTITYWYPLSMPLIRPIIDQDGDGLIPITASVTDTILQPPCP